MTELLFQTDSYLQEFTATVVDVNPEEGAVAFERTAFYPGGGGQPHDLGLLHVQGQTYAVTRVKQQSGQVWHWLNGELPAPGTAVIGQLDWARRYKLMRTHTALHILYAGWCGVITVP
jgi:misacylated tRNA(Ala) deacylase